MKQQKKEKEKEKEKGKAAPLFLLFFSLFEAAPLFTVETGKQQKKKEKEKEKKGRPRLCFCSSLSFRPRFCLHKNRKQPGTSSSTLSPKPEREAEEKRIQKAKRKGRLD
jgi:ribonuclease I